LAYVIAYRAQYSDKFNVLGLEQGEALLGDSAKYGMSQREYRTAKEKLSKWQFATFKTTNKGTIGKLSDTRLFNPSNIPTDNQNDNREANDRQACDNQATTTNKDKKDKEGEEIPQDGLLSEFKKEYPRPAFNKSAVAAVDQAWKKAVATGDDPKAIVEALKRKKTTTPDFNFWGTPVNFLIEHGRGTGRKNADWKSVGGQQMEISAGEADQKVTILSKQYPAIKPAFIQQYPDESPEFYKELNSKHEEYAEIAKIEQLTASGIRSLVLKKINNYELQHTAK